MPTSEAIADGLRERALEAGNARLECAGCGEEAAIVSADSVLKLVEHALFDHVSRQSILAVTITEMVGAYDLALERGLPAQTDWEQKWRIQRQGPNPHA